MENVGIRDERAQIILIGAFLIAIGVISALLIVNDIGFSQTIATQDGGEEGFESLEFEAGVEQAVSEAMEGNGTTPQNASIQFEKYLRGYSNETNEALQAGGIRSNVEPDTSNLTTAWMVGQRSNGTFVNATGETEWIMVENVEQSKNENIRGRFDLNVSDMSPIAGNANPFVLEATEDTNFENLNTSDGLGNQGNVGWNLSVKINETIGGDNFLRLNLTEFEIVNSPAVGNITVIDENETVIDVTGQETVRVDIFNETVDGNSSDFPDFTPGREATDADGFKLSRASNGEGTYEFRFNASLTDSGSPFSTSSTPNGPCDHPDGPPCRSADGTEKHIVGVVHNVTGTVADIEYISRSTSYENTIGTAGGTTLDAEDVNLNQIENVDGNASFNLEILKTTSPGQEQSSSGSGGEGIEIVYKVENTGTEKGKQNVNLTIPGVDANNVENATIEVDARSQKRSDNFVPNKNVSWGESPNPAPEFGKNGTYTAFVVSENTTTGERTVNSTVISVDKNKGGTREPAIPDSPVGFALPSWDAMAEAAAVAEGVSR